MRKLPIDWAHKEAVDMKKTYFLTAVFENKFGKAKKYFDGDSWHWMLNSDQPQMYFSVEEAKKKAYSLREEDLMDLSIKEVNLYEGVWEHKIPRENIQAFLRKNGQPRSVLFYQEQKKEYLFLSKEKQHEAAQCIEGLYCIDRKRDSWIYCVKNPLRTEKTDLTPDVLMFQAYEKVKEAKALMILFEEEIRLIEKTESLLLLMKKVIPSDAFQSVLTESNDLETSSHKLLHQAFQKLEEAHQIALGLHKGDQIETIIRLQGICRRLL